MRSGLRMTTLLTICIVALAACAPPRSIVAAPAATPAAPRQTVEPTLDDQVVLASGPYQLLMLYAST